MTVQELIDVLCTYNLDYEVVLNIAQTDGNIVYGKPHCWADVLGDKDMVTIIGEEITDGSEA